MFEILENYRTDIDKAMGRELDWLAATAPEREHPLMGAIYEWAGHYIKAGGKRFHGTTTLIAYEAAGGIDTAAVLPIAAAVQHYHHHTLVHDDIYDGDSMRRGLPTSHIALARHIPWATAGAVPHGSLFIDQRARGGIIAAFAYGKIIRALAGSAIMRSPLPVGTRARIVTLLEEHDLSDNAAQLLDVFHEGGHTPDPETCEHNAWLKTGLLFEVCAEIGAVAGGASDDLISLLRSWASDMAVAYQLRDDLEDLQAESEKGVGRGIGTDILTTKPTFVLSVALQRAQGADRRVLQDWVGDGPNPSMGRIIEVLVDSGAVEATQQRVAALVEHGIETIHALEGQIPEHAAVAMEALLRYGVSHEYWYRELKPASALEAGL